MWRCFCSLEEGALMPTVNDFVFREPAEKSREIARRDMQSISPSYTRSYGFTVSHGRGAKVWDVDGNSYIDFASGIAVLSTGYSHPRIVKAIQEQAEKYIHIGGTDFFSPEPVELAEKLQRLTPIKGAQPQDKRVYFGNSGAEAVESALKLARYATGRPYVIGFYGAFHGRTMGALSVTASKAIQRANYPYIPGGVEHVHYPNRQQPSPFGDPITYIKDVILKKKMPADEVAAIIVEPIQGEGGYIVPP
ncbi:MAG: aminotransferase class III-fold pyridoxal phosphate-dependent enzyme, partial [Chloroflexi bacterium]